MQLTLGSLIFGAMALQTSALPGAIGGQTNQNSNSASVQARQADYVPGACGVNVIQYQKNEGPSGNPCGTSEYRLTITLKDALQDVIGGATNLCSPGGQYVDTDSELPYVFESLVGGVDTESVYFMYDGQAFNSGSSQCSLGAYSGGSRSMDCGFTC